MIVTEEALDSYRALHSLRSLRKEAKGFKMHATRHHYFDKVQTVPPP